MSIDLKKCESQALRLSARERAALAERLIASLDVINDAENERLWVREAEKRYQQYKKGRVTARNAQDVFRDIRSEIA
jgi:hypothetical protein